jgi:hypothetical protein
MKSATVLAAILLLAFASGAPAADKPGAASTRAGPAIELVDLIARCEANRQTVHPRSSGQRDRGGVREGLSGLPLPVAADATIPL